MTVPSRALVYGLGVTGIAVARALVRHGAHVVTADDHPSPAGRAAAESMDVELLEAPDEDALRAVLGGVDTVLPAPGLPDRHPVFVAAAAAGVAVRSEFDLARAWDRRPLVAVTGTDGKTTVTTLVTDALVASGRRAVAAGNTEVPLVEAIDDPTPEVFVVEASSFRLGHTHRFEPQVATWLNFAPDHLDVHASLAAYEQAKANLWAHLPAGATAVANAGDPVVLRHVPSAHRVVTFGVGGDYRATGGVLQGPDDQVIVPVAELARALPHDVDNALAAAATSLAAGATTDGVGAALRAFTGLPHRVEQVAEIDGVRYVDDSKATVPHATLAALAGFERVVLIAGGRNKGLDLRVLTGAVDRLRAVVAIGEAAPEVAEAFAGQRPVRVVTTGMDDAVDAAAALAEPGDVVLLSPGCASFDWFPGGYHERGSAFRQAVVAREHAHRRGGRS